MKELKNLKPSNNKDLLVVVPVKTFEDEILNESFYNLANQSNAADVLIMVSDSVTDDSIKRIEEIADEPSKRTITQDEEGNVQTNVEKSEKKLNYAMCKTSSTNFAGVFNEAFNIADENGYKWVSVIEKDDLVELNWIQYFNIYSSEMENISIFFPLTRQIAAGNMSGHLNEAVWLEGRAEVAGQADLQILMAWNCLNPTGCMVKIEPVKEVSEERDGKYYPYKENMSISSSYEFFLRMVYEDLKTYTIPRNGYQMRMNSGSAIDNISSKIPTNITSLPPEQGGMSNHEIGFWMEQAKSEYFMAEDREIEYEAPSEQPAQ